VLSGAFTAGGTLDIVAKDLHLACDLAREVAAPAHLGLLAHDVLNRAQAQGWGGQGFPIAARFSKRWPELSSARLRSRARPFTKGTTPGGNVLREGADGDRTGIGTCRSGGGAGHNGGGLKPKGAILAEAYRAPVAVRRYTKPAG